MTLVIPKVHIPLWGDILHPFIIRHIFEVASCISKMNLWRLKEGKSQSSLPIPMLDATQSHRYAMWSRRALWKRTVYVFNSRVCLFSKWRDEVCVHFQGVCSFSPTIWVPIEEPGRFLLMPEGHAQGSPAPKGKGGGRRRERKRRELSWYCVAHFMITSILMSGYHLLLYNLLLTSAARQLKVMTVAYYYSSGSIALYKMIQFCLLVVK